MAERELSDDEVAALGLERELSDSEVSALGLEAPAPSGPFGGGAFRGTSGAVPEGERVVSQTGGASGGWGYPDPGFLTAMLSKFNQGSMKGGSDELSGLLGGFAARANGYSSGAGRYLRMPDGSERPAFTEADLYRASRDFERQQLHAAEQHYPKLGFLAEMGGDVASDVAVAGPRAIGRGYQTLAGLARGLMHSDAELTPDKMTPWTVGEAGLSSLFGGAIGNQAPVLMSKVAKSGAAKYLGSKADDALTYSGDKLKDLAGWLKVNSLHPVPKLAEAMQALPGGTPGVGREMLERDIGGLTKAATAKQAKAAYGKAGAAIDEIAEYHDAAGGAPIDIRAAIATAKAKAQELLSSPTKKRAGQQLMELVSDYEAKFPQGSAPASEILTMKRELGEAAYGASEQLKMTKDKLHGYLGDGISAFERATDDAMDKALGPGFEAANLVSRRLRGANQAADRTAAREQTNQLVSLKSWVAANALPAFAGGGAGGMIGGPIGAAVGLTLGTKYGSQAAARSLFGGGRALQSLPRLGRYVGQQLMDAPGPTVDAMSRATGGTLVDLIEQLRPSRPPLVPAYAMDGER